MKTCCPIKKLESSCIKKECPLFLLKEEKGEEGSCGLTAIMYYLLEMMRPRIEIMQDPKESEALAGEFMQRLLKKSD